MKIKYVAGLIALTVMCLAALKPTQGQVSANRSRVFFVKITGSQKIGPFRGESLLKGHQDWIEGIRFSSQVTSPRDAATGQPSGKRQYSPITFTKVWGPSSPQIFQACVTNEVLSTVKFEFWTTISGGQEVMYQTIILTNATVSSFRRSIGVPMGNEPPDPRDLEDVSLTFQKIEITDNAKGGITAMDDWMVTR